MTEDERELTDYEAREAAEARALNYSAGNDEITNDPAPAMAEPEDAGEEEQPLRVPVGSEADDIAEEIAERQAAQLEGVSREYDNDMSKLGNQIGSFADEAEPDGGEPVGDAPSADSPPPQVALDDMLVEVNVRGERRLVPVAELRAQAQKVEAGDTYLSDARKILEDAKVLRDAVARGEAPPTPQQHAEAEKTLTPELGEKRRSLFEAITYGTPEEVESAFQQFQAETEERAIQRLEQRQAFSQRKDAFLGRVQNAQAYISEQMPDLASNPGYVKAFAANLAEGQKFVLADFVEKLPPQHRARLAQHNVTPDLIRSLTSPKRIMETYSDFAIKGYKVPNIDEVMVMAGQITRRELGLSDHPAQPGRGTTPASDPGRGRVQLSSDRMARKDQLTPQTTRASVGPGQSSQSEARRGVSESDFHKSAMNDLMESGYTIPRRTR